MLQHGQPVPIALSVHRLSARRLLLGQTLQDLPMVCIEIE